MRRNPLPEGALCHLRRAKARCAGVVRRLVVLEARCAGVVRTPVVLVARCGQCDRMLGVVPIEARYAGRDPVLSVVQPNARYAGVVRWRCGRRMRLATRAIATGAPNMAFIRNCLSHQVREATRALSLVLRLGYIPTFVLAEPDA